MTSRWLHIEASKDSLPSKELGQSWELGVVLGKLLWRLLLNQLRLEYMDNICFFGG